MGRGDEWAGMRCNGMWWSGMDGKGYLLTSISRSFTGSFTFLVISKFHFENQNYILRVK